ncbi:hypothetical protein M4E66_002103 [Listeria monocytogenes]|nr:hypothetical protein [Listeria monocytogenes]EAD3661422.1 hypothetical protein [Listeria monocytogenes]EAE3098558.1 hypothetical protein [Listeria monocytogenes]EAE4184201.1 hypothetical protein [Listeria monocytogenes]EAH4219876.1 hypothetical protein [Listeria monocytogenes]
MIISEKFKEYIISDKKTTDIFNEQTIYKFPNNYGASVVLGPYTYGTELAVIYFSEEDYAIDYNTPITNDILGHLNEVSLKRALEDIYNLPTK